MEIKEMASNEKPIMRLEHFGKECLSNAELIQIITGLKDSDSAYRLLNDFDIDGNIQMADIKELSGVDGVSKLMGAKLIAAMEFGKRLATKQGAEKYRIACPEDVASYVMEDLRYKKQECLMVLLLNVKNEVIGKEIVSVGGISSSIVDPRDVFRAAIKKGAAGIIAIHNHPSGNPEPSESDVLVTSKLAESGELLGIELIDHVIVGDGRHVSLANRKLISTRPNAERNVADSFREREGR